MFPEDFDPYMVSKQAEKGDPVSQYNMGVYCEQVLGDYEKMFYWYKSAAESNLSDAQFNLGNCYRDGLGGKADLIKAESWYKKAVRQNHINAMYNLAVIYDNNGATPTNGPYINPSLHADKSAITLNSENRLFFGNIQEQYKTAIALYTKAADMGHAKAAYNLGLIYKNGDLGVNKSIENAKAWLTCAADLGDLDAIAILKSMSIIYTKKRNNNKRKIFLGFSAGRSPYWTNYISNILEPVLNSASMDYYDYRKFAEKRDLSDYTTNCIDIARELTNCDIYLMFLDASSAEKPRDKDYDYYNGFELEKSIVYFKTKSTRIEIVVREHVNKIRQSKEETRIRIYHSLTDPPEKLTDQLITLIKYIFSGKAIDTIDTLEYLKVQLNIFWNACIEEFAVPGEALFSSLINMYQEGIIDRLPSQSASQLLGLISIYNRAPLPILLEVVQKLKYIIIDFDEAVARQALVALAFSSRIPDVLTASQIAIIECSRICSSQSKEMHKTIDLWGAKVPGAKPIFDRMKARFPNY